jgi:hypothetical protein
MKLSRRRPVAVLAAGIAAAAATVASLLVGSPAGAVPGCVTPPDFDHSIAAPIGGPAAAPTQGGTIFYSTIGGDGKTYFVDTDIQQPGLAVAPLECFGGGAVDTPAVTEWGLSRALYVLAPNGRIYQTSVKNGTSTQAPWTQIPGAPAGGGAPVVTHSPVGGPIQMFVRGSDNQLYHASRGPREGDPWSAWESLGGGLTGLAAAGPVAGGTVVVVRAPNGVLYQKSGRTGAWGPWIKLTGTTSASPTIAAGFGNGRLDLFVTGTAGGLYQATATLGSTKFGAFRKVDVDLPVGAKLAAAGKSGRMIVYATVQDGADTVVGYDQYYPGLGWSGFDLAPYTCDDCLPVPAVAATSHRRVQTEPMR